MDESWYELWVAIVALATLFVEVAIIGVALNRSEETWGSLWRELTARERITFPLARWIIRSGRRRDITRCAATKRTEETNEIIWHKTSFIDGFIVMERGRFRIPVHEARRQGRGNSTHGARSNRAR